MAVAVKLKALQVYLAIMAALLFAWWPLSHWFFSDWYHGLLGFAPGSYADDMVKMIGTGAAGTVPQEKGWIKGEN
jgi:hypothetical protein